jgi:hypothetical protein
MFVKSKFSSNQNKDSIQKRDMSKVKCFGCDMHGHFRKDCKSLKNKYSKPKINMVNPSKPNISVY